MCDNNSPGKFVNILLVQIYIQYITGYNVSQYILGVEMFWKCIKISTASFTASNSKLSGRPVILCMNGKSKSFSLLSVAKIYKFLYFVKINYFEIVLNLFSPVLTDCDHSFRHQKMNYLWTSLEIR